MSRILFFIVFFIAYVIQAITGFAGNMLVMPVGTYTIGFDVSVAAVNVTGVLGCGLVALMGWRHINYREFTKMLIVMTIFMFIGIWVDSHLSLEVLMVIYGVVIFGVGLKNLLEKESKPLPEWGDWVVLSLAGLVQGMFVSGGALLVIYAAQKLKDKEEFRATVSLIWVVLNAFYAIFEFQGGAYTPDVVGIILICIPLLLAATWIGNMVSKRISQERFMKLTFGLLVVIGILVALSAVLKMVF